MNDQDQIEELTDLVELVYAIMERKGIGVEEFEKVRLAKREGHGGFERKYMLINVNEPYTFDTVKLFRRNKDIIFILTIEKFIYYCSHNQQINEFSLKALTAHNNTGDFQQFRRLKELEAIFKTENESLFNALENHKFFRLIINGHIPDEKNADVYNKVTVYI